MKRAPRDPLITALIRTICGCTDASLTVARADNAGWASATFIGARHELVLLVGGEDAAARAEALAAMLPSHEFNLRGHLIADIAAKVSALGDGTTRLMVEILTVED